DPQSQVVYREVSEGRTCPGLEFYFPLFFDSSATLFSYLPDSAMLITYRGILDGVRTYRAEIQDRYANANLDSTRRVLAPEFLYMDN
ncbi:MAG: hypothetical protein GWM98_01350, partial [Nitrospinaceae bacterium]|nr:hypothetical protein [Nitrospinaceae bacterium]